MGEYNLSHKIAWFDVPVLDLKRAMSFYSKVLDCDIREEFEGVAVLQHANDEVAGCLTLDKRVQPTQHGVLIYYNVNGRLAEAVEQVTANGGKVLQAQHSIGPFGYRAIVLDSEGNRIALHSD
ncbi:MAG: VOC family protein [Gammaproteobacteria bacterium]|nr:VOC family protein [Gammaproteobacteria bacterium]